MVTITNTTIPRDEVWRVFRRVHDVRLRERYRCILLLMDGRSCAEIAQWLYRDHAFNSEGLQGLEREPIPGRPA